MTSAPQVVTYDGLPASAGGAHSLRTKDPVAAFDKVQRFIERCRPVTAPEASFRLWAGGDEEIAGWLTAFAGERFGGPRLRDRTHTTWHVRADAVPEALAALRAAGTLAVTSHGGPIASLVWSAAVAPIDPSTRAPYAGIGPDEFGRFAVDGYGRTLGASGVRATVGTSSTSLSLWLSLPGDARLGRAAEAVQTVLPFKLSTRHWRRWTPTRDGQSWRSARIPSPLVAEALAG